MPFYQLQGIFDIVVERDTGVFEHLNQSSRIEVVRRCVVDLQLAQWQTGRELVSSCAQPAGSEQPFQWRERELEFSGLREAAATAKAPLAETEDGKLFSVSLWDSGDQAQKANELAASWVRENLDDRIRLESAQVRPGDGGVLRPARAAGTIGLTQ